jgi:hypothetical protein
LAIDHNLAFVGNQGAGRDRHQRRLSCAILAD